MSNVDENALLSLAGHMRAQAYAPYSGVRVGAAVLVERDGEMRLFGGANVENASFGLSICAERVALCAAVSSGFGGTIRALAVAGPDGATLTPCGACRQFAAEFGDLAVIYTAADTVVRKSIRELLPAAFDSSLLRR